PAAPLGMASMPSPPAPAYRSSARVPARSPSSANSASFTRSEVGRVVLPGGAFRRLPPSAPAITRTPARLSGNRLQRLAAEALEQPACQQRVLGRAQVGIGADDRLGPPARPLEQARVIGPARDAEVAEARLAGPHQLALLAQREIDLRQ